jgi:hypothetical protein
VGRSQYRNAATSALAESLTGISVRETRRYGVTVLTATHCARKDLKQSQQKTVPTVEVWNGSSPQVSPFDGPNRIRFKGSLKIADCQLLIADFSSAEILFSSRPIGNRQSTDRQCFQPLSLAAPPKTFSIFKYEALPFYAAYASSPTTEASQPAAAKV